uniref:NADH dehydrogenase subunit 2 n=1 Tax=Branchipolynoe onnuriensis TaxID=2928633 RepID=UPI00207A9F49|nr:NADH dehydrogenase subunit 2 [Branchipolynoe onnuriensis]URS74515.1 NADH dehydrogenase subunit 2 [Branchipolynoe onnuriensis]
MPFTTLFSVTLILGSILSISSTQWIFVWLGLELNLMSFIPLLVFSNKYNEAEASMKYFLAQAMGSGLILLGSLSFFMSPQILLNPNLMNLFLFLGLITKLGIPPCHFWFPSVMAMISWPMCLILTTWQKLVPIIILSYSILPNMNFFIIMIILLSSIIGGIGGLNQTQLRPLLAYSSIGHMSWMMAAMTSSYSASIIYLITYISITIPLMLLLWTSSSMSNLSSLNISSNSPSHNIFLSTLLLSLGGLPPFLGFFPKWMVMETLSTTFMLVIFITLLGSVINLYYYLNLMFINILTPTFYPLLSHKNNSGEKSFILPLMASFTLGLGPLMFLLI